MPFLFLFNRFIIQIVVDLVVKNMQSIMTKQDECYIPFGLIYAIIKVV
jgi:hypothetical protein